MINIKVNNGVYGDLGTWVNDSDVHNKLYRVWYKEDDESETCDFVFFTELIMLPDGDILIGLQEFDENKKNKRYGGLDYYKLSQITFAYYESDQDFWDEEDD